MKSPTVLLGAVFWERLSHDFDRFKGVFVLNFSWIGKLCMIINRIFTSAA